ncbi:MAG: cold shock domain-containing protein [Bacteriovoracaceae bacterium]|nr:cold shock domain-containing protein [Bacteriovoracaceae bacterium]
MSEVNVELVKYDTKKTKKRKRANLIVSAKTEAAVIEKLEKIHKGDQVESINEIIWGEAIVKTQTKKGVAGTVIRGVVKFYDEEKGFGFINSDTHEEDLFFHSTALNGESLYDDDLVQFEMSVGPKGPIAIHIKLIEE